MAETGSICGGTAQQATRKRDFENIRDLCCAHENTVTEGATSAGDCDSAQWPKGPGFNDIIEFAGSNDSWLNVFAKAWKIATENGHYDLGTPLGTPEADDPTYECNKLHSFAMCEKHFHAGCDWVRTDETWPSGARKKACVLVGETIVEAAGGYVADDNFMREIRAEAEAM